MAHFRVTSEHDGLRCWLGAVELRCNLHQVSVGRWSARLNDVAYVRVSTALQFVEIAATDGIHRWYIADQHADPAALQRLEDFMKAAVGYAQDPGDAAEIPVALEALLSPGAGGRSTR